MTELNGFINITQFRKLTQDTLKPVVSQYVIQFNPNKQNLIINVKNKKIIIILKITILKIYAYVLKTKKI